VTWWAIIVLAAGTYTFKAAGPIALGARTVPPRLQRALTLVSVTLLAGLVAISTFGEGRGLALDARAAGLGVALGAVWLKAPFAVIVVAATATAAGLRALGVS
jgi:branched-subunit amino acid transport protein